MSPEQVIDCLKKKFNNHPHVKFGDGCVVIVKKDPEHALLEVVLTYREISYGCPLGFDLISETDTERTFEIITVEEFMKRHNVVILQK